MTADGSGTPGQIRTLQWAIKHAELAGVALPPEEREAVNNLMMQSSQKSQAFDNHVIDSTAAFRLLLSQPAEVDGLPQSLRAQLAAAAVRTGEAKGATPDAGPWLVTLDAPTARPFLQHSQRRDLREAVYRAQVARASAHGPGGSQHDNSELLCEILSLRSRQASLLGYQDWASLSLASKMAPSVDAVMTMMSDLQARALPAAQKELGELRAFAAANAHLEGGRSSGSYELAHWDLAFWSERMQEAKFGLDESEVMRYFPLPAVLDGMWGTLRDVYGVSAECVSDALAPPLWHPDASFWRVSEGGSPIASFYLDPYARVGSKRGGAWADVAVGRTTNPALAPPGGHRNPVAYLVCNTSPPVGGAHSLMRHSDVLTLWHEVGHGLHHMLTRVPEGDVAGLAGVEWDAVELPSQHNEEFAWHPAVLRRMSRHVETGEPIPDALVARMRAARNHMAATAMLRQLYFSVTDLAIHSGTAAAHPSATSSCGFDPFAVQRHVAGSGFTLLPPLPEDRFLCSFSHIFSGGYSAGYYSYKHAEILSADAWEAFEEGGMSKPTDAALTSPGVAAVGRRYRDTVLGLGGSVHPSEVFRRFRGRDPQVGPLLRQAGLA